MSSFSKKILSFILIVMLLFSVIPLNVSAAGVRIGSVSVLDIETPTEGKESDYGVYIPDSTYSIADWNGDGYKNGIKWYDEFGNIMEPEVDRYRVGVSYTVEIVLNAIEPNIFMVVNAKINDESVDYTGTESSVTLKKTFPPVENEEDIHTITYNYGFDGLIDYTFCKDGEIPDTPDYIENGELTLFNWYTDSYFTEVFDANAPVYEDINAYARYVAPSDIVTIYMYTDDPEFPYSIEDAVIGDYVNVDDPDYYDTFKFFTGWYADPELTTEYDFSQPIEGDVHLYARLISYDDVAIITTYKPEEYFYTNYYEVEKGEYFYIPDLEVEDMYFDGWFYDVELTEPYNPELPVNDDFAVYAKLIPYSEMHTVSIWLFPDAEFPIGSGYVKDGDVYNIEEPYQEGMFFDGWYTEPEFINKLEVPFTVTSDIDIYAKFVPAHIVSIYVFSDSEPIISIEVAEGETYTPAEPGMEGMIFDGWYTEPERVNKYDTNTPITEDIALYAKFISEYTLGDVDGDGIITIMDATAIQRHIAKLIELDGTQQKSADTDYDFSISVMDATTIQRFIAKLITEF